LRQRLDQHLIVTPRRSDGNPESYRPQRVIQCACGDTEKKQSGGQQQEQRVPPFPAPARHVTWVVKVVC
jgi:hypothetical protein